MKAGWPYGIPLALAAALLGPMQEAAAQAPATPRAGHDAEAAPAWRPVVLSYFLRQAGAERLDPFAMEGRREVLQLLVQGGPRRGRFVRVRLDRMGTPGDGRETGWYEIGNGTLTLYHADAEGATGRVEVGRYDGDRLCMADAETGRLLIYEFLRVEDERAPLPPATPATGACADDPDGRADGSRS